MKMKTILDISNDPQECYRNGVIVSEGTKYYYIDLWSNFQGSYNNTYRIDKIKAKKYGDITGVVNALASVCDLPEFELTRCERVY